MQLKEALLHRRSIRRYTTDVVADQLITDIIRAGMYAPSAANKQPWHFIVIRQQKTFEDIVAFHPHARMLLQAQAAILVCSDSKLEHGPGYGVVDCSAAVENMLLYAHGLGLGACWIGIHPREERKKNISELLNLPGHVAPIALISLGYPAETKATPERFEPTRIHYEKWPTGI